MNTYFIEWTSEGCGIKGALVIANSQEEAEQMVRIEACPHVQEIVTSRNQTEQGACIWHLGELED